MTTITRILAATVILAGLSDLSPAGSAHIVPIDRAGGISVSTPAPSSTCPLRAWPYIG